MKIKKIEMQGFKSFVDRMSMTFPPGINAVVGPNGCGKSNLVDAIRWVMGEQSAKHLRGKFMEDIIFNGSEARKPVGMAEVCLTFDNSDGIAPARYASYSEISVSRRLFRSGESDYFINQEPCRLKDITELLMDTGVGTKAYSIVEQGKIGNIITMKPEDRRTLIEEAAGITKYKSRKNAALKKIESTENNLQRVRDVIREVKRQINSLERQARKAKKYKVLKEEIKEIELSLAAVKYNQIKERLNNDISLLNSLTDEELNLAAVIAKTNVELEEAGINAADAENRLTSAQKKVFAISTGIVELNHKIGFNEKEEKRLKDDEERYSMEISLLETRLDEITAAQNDLQSELKTFHEREAGESAKLQLMEEEFSSFVASFEEMESGYEKTKSELVHIATLKSNLNNSIIHLGGRLDDIEKRQERKRTEKKEVLLRLKKSKESLAALEPKTAKLNTEKSSLNDSQSSKMQKLREMLENAQKNDELLNSLRERQHMAGSKLSSLKELKFSYEGAMAGVKSIMHRHKKSPAIDGVSGIAADFLIVPKEYETAIGAALAAKLQYVIVDGRSKVMEAIEYLKKNSSGRGTFISKDMVDYKSDATYQDNTVEGAGVPLGAKIGTKKGFEWLIDALFNNLILVPTINDALKLRNSSFRGAIVTQDGDLIEEGCGISGGAGESSGFDLLKREREIKELSSELNVLEDKHKELLEENQRLFDKIAETEKSLDLLKSDLFKKDMEISGAQNEKALCLKEMERDTVTLNVIKMEEKQLLNESIEFKNEITSSKIKIKELESEERLKNKALLSLHKNIASLKDQVELSRQKLTEQKVINGSFKDKRQNLEKELENLISSGKETERRLERDKKLLLDTTTQSEKNSAELSKARKSLVEMSALHTDMEKLLAEKKNRYEQLTENMRKTETELRKLHKSREELAGRISDIKVSAAEKEIELKHLLDGLVEKYNVDLLDMSDSSNPANNPNHANLSTVEAETRLKYLLNAVAALGEVNLTALYEHNENKERLIFLQEQEKDLAEAIESLKKAISRINVTSRKKFKNAFEAINGKFKELFPSLFQGGKANLVLTDENLLETGVDIVVQPPGKKLQNLNLLSGGEKALTAITLIFSIFMVKPTPFCLLDEVDAPLDDANVGRFNELVKKMSAVSQIILITHNKRSIQIGDTLYGITMEDPGISKLVSVQLN